MKKEFNSAARLTHIALQVKDIEASVAFYKNWTNMTEVSRRVSDRTGETVVWMACEGQEDEFVIVLLDGADKNLPEKKEGMRHLGFSVKTKEDVRRIADEAKEQGILHWDYMEMDYPVGTLCSVIDPDGHIVEFSYGQPLGPDFKAKKEKEEEQSPTDGVPIPAPYY